jgi:hypothetical protein
MQAFNRYAFLFILMPLFACDNRQAAFTEAVYLLKRSETISIKQLNLQISNRGCGRHWEGDPGTEKPYCDLEIRAGDSVWYGGSSFKPFIIRDLEFTVEKMNPWNKAEDSIPAGGCMLRVRKLNSRIP